MPVKGSTITDENYLKILAQAREKALANRQKKAEEKKKIKLAQDLEHQTKLKEAEDKLKDVTEAVVATKAAKVSREKKPEAPMPEAIKKEEPPHEEPSEEEVEEDEPQPPPPKKKVAPKPPATPQQSRPAIVHPSQLSPQQLRMAKAFASLYA